MQSNLDRGKKEHEPEICQVPERQDIAISFGE
jgi:hypothetical protein